MNLSRYTKVQEIDNLPVQIVKEIWEDYEAYLRANKNKDALLPDNLKLKFD